MRLHDRKTRPEACSRHRDRRRDFYADESVWEAVQTDAGLELKAAVRLAYLNGQRTADVLKMHLSDLDQHALLVKQGKTSKFLRIALTVDSARSPLGTLIDHLTRSTDKQALRFTFLRFYYAPPASP